MSDEDGRQFGQAGRIRLQRFVGGFGGIRARARIDANQFPMVVGHHEIVFREFKTGEHVDAAGKDLGYAPGRKRDRKSTRLNSSHSQISYAVFCLKKKKT